MSSFQRRKGNSKSNVHPVSTVKRLEGLLHKAIVERACQKPGTNASIVYKMMDAAEYSKNEMTTSANSFHLVSDEESLEDHSGIEDFRSVTLQMKDDHGILSPGSPQTQGITHSDLNDGDPQNASASGPNERTILLSLNTKKSMSLDQTEAVPRISITPMTPPSESLSPDAHSTVSLNSSGGSPLFQSQKYRGRMSSSPNLYWRPQSPMPPKNEFEAKEFFAYRDSIVQTVLDEIQALVEPELDGPVRGTWLLTEIDHWDNEKERIVLLTEKSMIIAKYDFIAMKQEEYRRIGLSIIDKIIQGELKYPDRSLAPRLSGIAGGLVGVVKDCIIPKVQDTVHIVGNAVLPKASKPDSSNSTENPTDTPGLTSAIGSSDSPEPERDGSRSPNKTSIMSALSLENFEPRTRNVQGIRVMWNHDFPLTFTQKWNPFNKSIPWITFASHPLLWHKGGGGINRSFDIETFSRDLIDVLSHGGGDSSPMCRVEYKSIIIETYLGLASLFHNANSLGFYKVRGKVSF